MRKYLCLALVCVLVVFGVASAESTDNVHEPLLNKTNKLNNTEKKVFIAIKSQTSENNTIAVVTHPTFHTIIDDLNELVQNDIIQGYDVYTDINSTNLIGALDIDKLWENLDKYKILLIDEDCMFEWDNPGPDYNKPVPVTKIGKSFYNHKAQLKQWIYNGGRLFSTDQNDISINWDDANNTWWTWLPDELQVESNQFPSIYPYPGIGYGHDPSNLTVVYDPGIFSYPNKINITKVEPYECHGRFTQYPGYTPLVIDTYTGDVLEVYRVYGNGIIVLSHLEYETTDIPDPSDGRTWDSKYIENEIFFITLTVELNVNYDPQSDTVSIEVTKAYCPIHGNLDNSNTISAVYNITDVNGNYVGINGTLTYDSTSDHWKATADVSSLSAGTYYVVVSFVDIGGHRGGAQAQFKKLVGSGKLGLSTPNCLTGDHVFVYATIFDPAGNRNSGRTDVYVKIYEPGGSITVLPLYDNSTGVSKGYDLNANDGEYSSWYKAPDKTGTYRVELYVGNEKMDEKQFTVINNPELVVLTDIKRLYDEFLNTGTARNEDLDEDKILDFYELLDKLYEYANNHRGIVYSLGKEITKANGYSDNYADLDYANSFNDRKKMGELIDQFIHNVNEKTKQTSWWGTKYPIKYIAIVGDDAVIPFYRKEDPVNEEINYTKDLHIPNPRNPTLVDTSNGYIMSDIPYMTRDTSIPTISFIGLPYGIYGLPDPDMACGRVFSNHPYELIYEIEKYDEPITIINISVLALNPVEWMKKHRTLGICPVCWKEYWLEPHDYSGNGRATDPNFPATAKKEVMDVARNKVRVDYCIGDPYWSDDEGNMGLVCEWDEQDFINNVNSHSVTYLLSHANHISQETSRVDHTMGTRGYITQDTYLRLQANIKGRIVVDGGCHSGYSISKVKGDYWYYNRQLVLGALLRNITYIAPTTYGIYTGGNITYPNLDYRGYFWMERMMRVYTEQLLTAETVDEAFKNAIKQYDNVIAILDKYDEYTVYAQKLYGLPTQRLIHPSVSKAASISSGTPSNQAIPLSTAGTLTPVKYSPDNVRIQQIVNDSIIKVSVDIPKFINITVGNNTLFYVPGGTFTAEAGGPILPQIVVSRLLPAGSNITNVTLISYNSTTYPKKVELFKAMPMVGIGEIVNVSINLTNPYPLKIYNVTTTEWKDGVLVVLNIIPLQYNPETKEVTLYDHLEFNITYTKPTPPTSINVNYVKTDKKFYKVGENVTIAVSITVPSSMNAELGVEVRDQSGSLLYSSDELLNLPSGTTIVTRNISTRTFTPGVKYVTVTITDPNSKMIVYTDTKSISIAGLYLTITLSKGMYLPNEIYANLTVTVRNETGELISGLSNNFTVAVDGIIQNIKFTEVSKGVYVASVNISGLSTGQHNITVAVHDSRGIEESTVIYFGIGEPVVVPLFTGWNLITLPLHPYNFSVSVVSSTIPNFTGLVYIWNNTADKYEPVSDKLELGKAYWIAVTSNGSWIPAGYEIHKVTINLSEGWNMVGVPLVNATIGRINVTVANKTYTLIQAIKDGYVGGIWYSWNATQGKWDATVITKNTKLKTGMGYFVWVSKKIKFKLNLCSMVIKV